MQEIAIRPQSVTPALSDDVLPPKPIQSRRRNRVFTSIALHRQKSEQSKSGSIDEQSFVADIKSKTRPKLTAMERHLEWLAKKQQRQASVFIVTSRVNLLDEMKCRLPPLRTIAEQSIRPTLRHHTPTALSSRSRLRASTSPCKPAAAVANNSGGSAIKRNSISAEIYETDITRWLQADLKMLKEFSYCVPDVNLYLIKLSKDQEVRKGLAVRKWSSFPARFDESLL